MSCSTIHRGSSEQPGRKTDRVQSLHDLANMLGIAGLDHGIDIRFFHRHVMEHALVVDLDDIAPGLADDSGQTRQGARLVGDLDAQAHHAPVAHKAPEENVRQNTAVDISDGDHSAYTLTVTSVALI